MDFTDNIMNGWPDISPPASEIFFPTEHPRVFRNEPFDWQDIEGLWHYEYGGYVVVLPNELVMCDTLEKALEILEELQ